MPENLRLAGRWALGRRYTFHERDYLVLYLDEAGVLSLSPRLCVPVFGAQGLLGASTYT